MSFLSLSDRLKCPQFGIRQSGGLSLSRLSEQERRITEKRGIKYDSDSFLDIQDPDESPLVNPELRKFQIGKELAVAHRRFDNLKNALPSNAGDPFDIISSYTKDLPIVFDVTQDIVDYAGRNPIKHEHVVRYHEFYDCGSAAHDLVLAPDETNKTLIYNHHGEACIAVRHEVLPFFLWHYHGFNVNGISFLIACKLSAAVRIQDCWNDVDARDPSTWRDLKTSDPPHYFIYFYVWRDLSAAQADPDLTGELKLGVTINDYVAKVNGGIWSQMPASSTFFMDGFPSDTPKDVLEDIVQHKFESDEMECHYAFLLNQKGRSMNETIFYCQKLYFYASVNIGLFPMGDPSFIKKCLPDSSLLALIQNQRTHPLWSPNECQRCYGDKKHIHSYGECNVLELSLDDFVAQLYVLVQQNVRGIDPDTIFTRKNIEGLLDKVLIEINEFNRGNVYVKMEQNDLVQEFEYEFGFNILCEMGHAILGSSFPLMVDLTTRPTLNLLPHGGRELSHSLTPPPTTKARLPILITNGNNVQSVRASSSPRTTTKRSINFLRNAQKVKKEEVSDEKSSPDNALNGNYSSPMATPPPPLSLPKPSTTESTYSVQSVFNDPSISGIIPGANFAKIYSPPPPLGGYPAGAPSPHYSGPRQLSHGPDNDTITNFLPSSPKKMRRGNGNQKIPESMDELFAASTSIKPDEGSGTKKRTFSQMMEHSNLNSVNLNRGQASNSNPSTNNGVSKEFKEEIPKDSLVIARAPDAIPFSSWYYNGSDDENGQVLDVGVISSLKNEDGDQFKQDLDHKLSLNEMESEIEDEDIDLDAINKKLKHSKPLTMSDLTHSNGLSSDLEKLNDLKISKIIVSDSIATNHNQSLSTPDSKRSNCTNSLNYTSTPLSGIDYGSYSGGASGTDLESIFNVGLGSGNLSCSESETGSKLLILSSGDFRRFGDENDLNECWKSDVNDGDEE